MIKKVLIIFFLITCCGFIVMATLLNSKTSCFVELRSEDYKQTITNELDTIGEHPWASTYYYGDGLGTNVTLLIAPKSGFLYEWQGCLGLYDRNYGSVSIKDGIVELGCRLENEKNGFGISEKLVPVLWEGRHYLIGVDEMIEFCNCVNSNEEPRYGIHGFHLLRVGDEKKEVSGQPDIPIEYKKYLLNNSVEAEIINVGQSTVRYEGDDWMTIESLLTLNVGKDSGLLPGMELYVIEPNDLVESVTITEVKDLTSICTMHQMDVDRCTPMPGWRLSTKPMWADISDVFRSDVAPALEYEE